MNSIQDKCKQAFLVSALIFIMSACSHASEITELWAQLSFSTESGDRVDLQTENMVITKISIYLKNNPVLHVPKECLGELKSPLLWGVRFMRSYAYDLNEHIESVALTIPLLKEDVPWDDLERQAMVRFLILDGRLTAGELWSDGGMSSVVNNNICGDR